MRLSGYYSGKVKKIYLLGKELYLQAEDGHEYRLYGRGWKDRKGFVARSDIEDELELGRGYLDGVQDTHHFLITLQSDGYKGFDL
jgi:hypothetical protein